MMSIKHKVDHNRQDSKTNSVGIICKYRDSKETYLTISLSSKGKKDVRSLRHPSKDLVRY